MRCLRFFLVLGLMLITWMPTISHARPPRFERTPERKEPSLIGPDTRLSLDEIEELDPQHRRAGRRFAGAFSGLVLSAAVFSAMAFLPCSGTDAFDGCSDGGVAGLLAIAGVTAPAIAGLGVWAGSSAVGPDRTGSTLGWDILAAYIGSAPAATLIGIGLLMKSSTAADVLYLSGILLAPITGLGAALFAHERQLRNRHRRRLTPRIQMSGRGFSIGVQGSL